MSLKRLLMPAINQWFLSGDRLDRQRARAEQTRQARGEPHKVHYFHQVDDPYSALAAVSLPRLLERYDINISAHVVGPPPDSAAPERDKLVAYSRRDAELLAQRWNLKFQDSGLQPSSHDVVLATRLLVAAIHDGRFIAQAGQLSSDLWHQPAALANTDARITLADTLRHVAESNDLRQRLGHYLGGTFFYAGEWYWGIDRLYHLEERLQALGVQHSGSAGLMFAPSTDLEKPAPLAAPASIDFYVSLRSPYSAIVAPRVFALGRRTGVKVRLRFVLPMVMRGLPMPRNKRLYISRDAAREARMRGIAFGRLNDPVGRPTERGLALIPFAEQAGKAESYLLSFMRGVWAEGIDAGSESGLCKIVERAGLDWKQARVALKDQTWRKTAEQNLAAMFDLGLWGVPAFHVGDVAVWGQDRLWAVEDELLKGNQTCCLS
jgi:2-hydroxychromene-2-carboxylate isomerase